MLLCFRNNGNRGKTSITKNMIEVLLNSEYTLIKAYYQGLYTEIGTNDELKKVLNNDRDFFTLFQNNNTKKYIAIITGGDEKEVIQDWFKHLKELITTLNIDVKFLSIVCTAKDYENGNRGVATKITDNIQKEPFHNPYEIIWCKTPYIFDTGKIINKIYFDTVYKNFAHTSIEFIENNS